MLTKDQRQSVIDEYMADTRVNMVVPRDFIEWLRPKEDHPAHSHFFAKSDEEAAQEYRLALFRQFASGLRISVRVEYSQPETREVSVNVREFPAYVSPASTRKSGGGYIPVVPEEAAAMQEVRRQGAVALRSWLARYRGAYEMTGVDLSPIEEIAAQILGGVEAA